MGRDLAIRDEEYGNRDLDVGHATPGHHRNDLCMLSFEQAAP